MFKPMKWLFWFFLFILSLLAMDQFLLNVPPIHPIHGEVGKFYKDFRQRLFRLAFEQPRQPLPANPEPQTIETIINQRSQTTQNVPSRSASRYLYTDRNGELHFADSLNSIPKEYRPQAQPLAD